MSKTKKELGEALETAAHACARLCNDTTRVLLKNAAVAYVEAPEDPQPKPFAVLVSAAQTLAHDLKSTYLVQEHGAPLLPPSAKALADAAIAYAASVATADVAPPQPTVMVMPARDMGPGAYTVLVDDAPVATGLAIMSAERLRIALKTVLAHHRTTFSIAMLRIVLADVLITENLKGDR